MAKDEYFVEVDEMVYGHKTKKPEPKKTTIQRMKTHQFYPRRQGIGGFTQPMGSEKRQKDKSQHKQAVAAVYHSKNVIKRQVPKIRYGNVGNLLWGRR